MWKNYLLKVWHWFTICTDKIILHLLIKLKNYLNGKLSQVCLEYKSQDKVYVYMCVCVDVCMFVVGAVWMHGYVFECVWVCECVWVSGSGWLCVGVGLFLVGVWDVIYACDVVAVCIHAPPTYVDVKAKSYHHQASKN